MAQAAPVSLSTSVANNDAIPAQRRGIAVVGIGEPPASSDAAWPVALAIYGDASLRPKLSDGAARALAGENDPSAGADVKDLVALRAQVKGDDPASRALLAEIARRTQVRAIALVFPSPDAEAIEVRIYDATEDTISSTRHRREKGSWAPLASTLAAKYAVKTAPPPPTPKPIKDESKGSTFFSSPWFWGALGAAAAAGVAAYVITRNSGNDSPGVRIDWGRK